MLPSDPPQPNRLRLWHAGLLFVVLAALLRLAGVSPATLTADEVDALEAGVTLAERLTSGEGSFRQRLVEGFGPTPESARGAMLPPDHRWRQAVVEAPLPRWAAALGVMLAPHDGPNLSRAATGAAALIALALVLLLMSGEGRAPWLGAATVGIAALTPGVLASAGAAGAAASGMVAMAALLVATDHLLRRGRAWPVGIAWALTVGFHPGALLLVVPVFVAWAIARRPTDPSAARGEAALPVAPLGLFAVPLIGLAVLVIGWPALWVDTGKRLMAWTIDVGWIFNPPYEVAGVVFDQHRDRAAMAWTGLVQWIGWTALPVSALFLLGLRRALRAGRDGDWFPILAALTLALFGAADGGLWGARLTLLPLLWVVTARVAAQGLLEGAEWVRDRRRVTEGRALTMVAAPTVALLVMGAWAGTSLVPQRSLAGELRRAVPVALFAEMAHTAPGSAVHITPTPEQWRPAVNALRDHLELDLRWGDGADVGWLAVAGRPDEATRARTGNRTARWTGVHEGVSWAVYRLDEP